MPQWNTEYLLREFASHGKKNSMAYNEKLANMTRQLIALTHKKVEEKAMFGGLCFMVNDKMCVGVEKDRLMVRLDPAHYDEVIEKEGCKPMDFTGRVMKGYVFVDADVLTTKKKLDYWVQLALEFNKIARRAPRAKASKPARNGGKKSTTNKST